MADALSRREVECQAIIAVTPRWIEEVVASYEGDEVARDIISTLLLNSQTDLDY